MFIRLQVFLAIVSIVLATSLEENKVADLQASESYAPSYGYGYGISHGYGYGNHGGHSVVVFLALFAIGFCALAEEKKEADVEG
ncbi:hypothetical protein QYM36_005314, partial [Artemia franciscana]